MEENKIQKPLILEMEEAKREMVQVINNIVQTHKLPFYIIEMIFENIHSQIKEGAKGELEMAKAQIENTNVEEG